MSIIDIVDEEYRISELSGLLDLTPETIRYYERMGIINPRHDESNRYRYYLSTEFSRLYNAKILRSLGFRLSEIKSFFYEKNNEEQVKATMLQAEKIKEQVKELERRIEVLSVFAEDIGLLDKLLTEYDIIESRAFWLVPIRSHYSYDVDSATLDKIRAFLSCQIGPRYSYILRAHMEEGLPCTERYVGYSIRGDRDRPTDNAIYVPSRKAMRLSWRLIVGERFDDGMKRCRMYQRFRDMGVEGDIINLYGHTINISTDESGTYLNHIAYVPLGDEPLVDWEYVNKICSKNTSPRGGASQCLCDFVK